MIRRLIILLLIAGCVFGEDLPPKSVLQNMTHDEQLDLYNSKKITLLKNILPNTRLATSQRENKIMIYGITIVSSISVYGLYLNDNKALGEILPYLALIGTYGTFIMLFIEKEKQRKLFNEKLYEEIFLISP